MLPNIINVATVDAVAARLANAIDRPEGRRWFQRNVRNFLCLQPCLVQPVDLHELPALLAVKDAAALPSWIHLAVAAGQTLHWFDPIGSDNIDACDLFATIRLLPDWTQALPNDDKRWRQFDKMSVPAAIGLAEAWHRSRVVEVSSGEATVAGFDDGCRVVRLESEDALRREGKLMRHCVGDRDYFELVRAGILEIYSFRDGDHRPQVTMAVQVATGTVQQVKGKQNSPPARRWQPRLAQFVANSGWSFPPDPRLRRLSEAPLFPALSRSDQPALNGSSAVIGPVELSTALAAMLESSRAQRGECGFSHCV